MTFRSITLLSLSFISIVACTPMTATHGNMIDEERQSAIQEGVSTRTDVFRAMGSPTTVSPFNDNIWYYIGQETEKHGIFDTEVVDEHIVAVTFNQDGIVQEISSMDNARLDVPLNDNKTPTYGNDMTVMQQLLGNLGKFNPAQGKE